jgi:hypothetical protein
MAIANITYDQPSTSEIPTDRPKNLATKELVPQGYQPLLLAELQFTVPRGHTASSIGAATRLP